MIDSIAKKIISYLLIVTMILGMCYSYTKEIKADSASVESVTISKLSSAGYTVTIRFHNTSGISKVQFPTWSSTNGQDDIVWYESSITNNTATCTVLSSKHGVGMMNTHIYTVNSSGKKECVAARGIYIPYNYTPVSVGKHMTMYGNHIYAVFDENLTWEAAKSKCEEFGGHLATITSEEENAVVESLVNQGIKEHYYLGAERDTSTESGWKWTAGNEGWSYTNWDDAQPDHIKETVLDMVPNSGGKWNDFISNSSMAGFVLEIDNELTPVVSKKYGDREYYLFDNVMPYEIAREYCRLHYGNLAIIDSAEKNTFIASLVSNGKKSNYYMGLEKDSVDHLWKYANGKEIGYANWNTNQPDNTNGIQNKGSFIKANGKWDDAYEYYAGTGFIMECPDVIERDVNEEWSYKLDKNTGLLTISGKGEIKGSEEEFQGIKEYIKEVEIKEGIIGIDDGTLSCLSNVITIKIPKSLKNINQDAMPFPEGSSFKEIIVDSGNSNFCSKEGILYSKNMDTIICVPSGIDKEEFVMPSTVEQIKNYAFRSSHIKKVIISNAVTSLTKMEFFWNYCEEIVFPESIEKIGSVVIFGAQNLKKITIKNANCYLPNHINVGFSEDITVFGYKNSTAETLSKNQKELSFIPMSDENERIYSCIFSNGQAKIIGMLDTSIREITIPKYIAGYKITEIGDNAFKECTNLTSVVVPETIEKIGKSAFRNCNNLSSIQLPESLKDLPNYIFQNCEKLVQVNIPEQLTRIGYNAFENCKKLVNIHIPNTVTSICPSAFKDCQSLKTVVLPEQLTSIKMQTFEGCSSLMNVVLQNKVVTIGESAFKNCVSLSEISIPETVAQIGEYAFYGCIALKDVLIPRKVSKIGIYAYSNCAGLETFTVKSFACELNSSFLSATTVANFYGCKNSTIGQWATKNKKMFIAIGHEPGEHIDGTNNEVYCAVCGQQYKLGENETESRRETTTDAEEMSEFSESESITSQSESEEKTTRQTTNVLEVPIKPIGLMLTIDVNCYFSWTMSNDAESYNVYINNNFIGTTVSGNYNIPKSYLSNVGNYTVSVEAVNQAGVSERASIKHMVKAPPANIYADNVQGNAGEQVTIPVYIKNNTGIMGISIKLSYDSEILLPQKVTAGSVLASGQINDNIETATESEVEIYWASSENVNSDGCLFYVTFNVLEEAEGESYIKMSYLPQNTFDQNWVDVDLDCRDITVNVQQQEYDSAYMHGTYQSVSSGTTVDIPIILENNTGNIDGLQVMLQYDRDNFELKGMEAIKAKNCQYIEKNNGIQINISGLHSVESGDVVKMTFAISKYAKGMYKFDLLSDDIKTEKICIDVNNTLVQGEDIEIYGDNLSLEDDILTVPIRVANNQGLMGYKLKVRYDSQVLQPIDAERNLRFPGTFVDNIGVYSDYYDVIWTGTEGNKSNGNIFISRFRVKKLNVDTAIELSYSKQDTFDGNLNDVKLRCNSISVNYNELIEKDTTVVQTTSNNNSSTVQETTTIKEDKTTEETKKLVETTIPVVSTTGSKTETTSEIPATEEKTQVTTKGEMNTNTIPITDGEMTEQNGSVVSEKATDITKSPMKDYEYTIRKTKFKRAKNLKGRRISLKWKKVKGVSGYEIQMSVNKKFKKKVKTKRVKAKVSKKIFKKFKINKIYYFRIRTFKKIENKKIYSGWSKKRKVKIKK